MYLRHLEVCVKLEEGDDMQGANARHRILNKYSSMLAPASIHHYNSVEILLPVTMVMVLDHRWVSFKSHTCLAEH